MEVELRKFFRRTRYSMLDLLRNLTIKCNHFCCKILFLLCNLLFKIDDKKIICTSYKNTIISCNPKYISQYILNHFPKEYDIVWILNNLDKADKTGMEEARFVKFGGLQYIFEMSTSKFILSNQRNEYIVGKRKGQTYIQLWHSSAGLKKIEGDAEDYLSKEYIKFAKKDSKKIDVMVSGSRFNTERFRRAFWFDGVILNIGTPRNDILFNVDENLISNIRLKLGISTTDKVVLYAPTFRSSYSYDYDLFDRNLVKRALENKYGGNWMILIKFHPGMLREAIYDQNYKNAINVSLYEDIQELYLVSDVIITDYSSVMFDFCLTKRPCILFVPDLMQYYASERGLNFKLDELPFPVIRSMKEFDDFILKFDEKSYQEKVGSFLEQIGSYENGQACKNFMEYMKCI